MTRHCGYGSPSGSHGVSHGQDSRGLPHWQPAYGYSQLAMDNANVFSTQNHHRQEGQHSPSRILQTAENPLENFTPSTSGHTGSHGRSAPAKAEALWNLTTPPLQGHSIYSDPYKNTPWPPDMIPLIHVTPHSDAYPSTYGHSPHIYRSPDRSHEYGSMSKENPADGIMLELDSMAPQNRMTSPRYSTTGFPLNEARAADIPITPSGLHGAGSFGSAPKPSSDFSDGGVLIGTSALSLLEAKITKETPGNSKLKVDQASNRKKRRGRRKGPLTKEQAWHAAMIKKVKPCSECQRQHKKVRPFIYFRVKCGLIVF